MINSQDCRSFCANPLLRYPGQFVALQGWDVAVVVQMLWSYTTLSGQMMAQDQPDSALRGMQAYQTVLLRLDWEKQSWLIVPSSSETDSGANDPFCSQGAQDIMGLLNATDNSWGMSTAGTKSRNSMFRQLVERIKQAHHHKRKKQFSAKSLWGKVVLTAFTPQLK